MSADLVELDNAPRPEQVREAILDAILAGRFENDRLPPERDLSKMMRVSRTTIRAALQSLERSGIVTRRRAVGTTINRHVDPSMLALQRLVGFDWLLEEKGHAVRVEQSWRRTVPPEDLVAALNVDAGEECFLTEKLYFADEAPAIFVRDLVPWRLIVRTPPDAPVASLFAFSRRYCSAPIDHAVADIVPLVQRDQPTKLELARGQAFLRLHGVHYSPAGEPVAYSAIDVDDGYIRFEVFRRR